MAAKKHVRFRDTIRTATVSSLCPVQKPGFRLFGQAPCQSDGDHWLYVLVYSDGCRVDPMGPWLRRAGPKVGILSGAVR